MERVVLLRVTRPLSPAEEAALLRFVDADKRGRLRQMSVKEPRQLSLLADVLVRLLAARQWGGEPRRMRIGPAPGGKPVFLEAPDHHFNVSHTSGGIVCGLSRHPVGVDIERERPVSDRVAACWFTPEERAWAGEDPARRLTLWTRKEAAAKWSGEGLASGIRSVNTLAAPWDSRLISRACAPFILSVCEEGVHPFDLECLNMTCILAAADPLPDGLWKSSYEGEFP